MYIHCEVCKKNMKNMHVFLEKSLFLLSKSYATALSISQLFAEENN